MVFLEILFSKETEDLIWEEKMQTYTYITQALLFVFAVYFI